MVKNSFNVLAHLIYRPAVRRAFLIQSSNGTGTNDDTPPPAGAGVGAFTREGYQVSFQRKNVHALTGMDVSEQRKQGKLDSGACSLMFVYGG
jgi:hypothetical protein